MSLRDNFLIQFLINLNEQSEYKKFCKAKLP